MKSSAVQFTITQLKDFKMHLKKIKLDVTKNKDYDKEEENKKSMYIEKKKSL